MRMNSACREAALRRVHAEGGLAMAAMVAELGLTVARVSLLLSRADRAREMDERAKTEYSGLDREFRPENIFADQLFGTCILRTSQAPGGTRRSWKNMARRGHRETRGALR